MNQQVVVRIFKVSPGKNRFWLTFYANIGILDQNRVYSFGFCGTELQHGLSLLESEIEDLRYKMCDDFGYGPYKIDDVRRILGKQKCYTLSRKGSSSEVGQNNE